MPMNAQYTRNFCIGTSYHVVKLYSEYTDEQGLAGTVQEFKSTRMADILKEIKSQLTAKQLGVLKICMKDKTDVIVLPDGKIGR
jgi:UDP-glucose 6-dehydrogenase